MMRGTRGRRASGGLLAIVLAVGLTACGGGPAADSPEGVVRSALDKMAAKDLDGLRSLACAGQEDIVRDQLGLPGALGSELVPGLDTQALMDAVEVDVGNVDVGTATVSGDVAQVPVSGDVGVTFDADKMRPLLRQVMEASGQTMTDEQLDALLSGMEAFGQDVPIDQSVRLIRESGAWKICLET